MTPQTASGTAGVSEHSESAKEANVLIPTQNKCTHFSFSLVVLVPDDGLPNKDQDLSDLEDDSESDSEEELKPQFS